MKKILVLLFVMLCLTGCSAQKESEQVLWVVTEQSNSDGMNYQADTIAQRMEETYPGLSVNLEVLPTDEAERELRLKQLRAKIMAGNGPDVYLLPTGSELVSDTPEKDQDIPIEPLFLDVAQAMQNGIFADISQSYDADTELNTSTLNATIMAAGCSGNARLVLPLRYQVPVIYTRPDLCVQYGLPEDLFESDILTLVEGVLSCEDAETAAIGLKLPEDVEMLGIPLDYAKGEVLTPIAQITAYMQLYRQRNEIAAQSTQAFYDKWELARRYLHFPPNTSEYSEYNWLYRGISDFAWPKTGEFYHGCFNLLSEYCYQLYHWSVCDIPLYTGYLSDILETLGVTKQTGQEVAIYPLRGADGCVTATVAYWGAVGTSCKNPELAYSFLREFLTEEFQWDSYRPRVEKDDIGMWEREPEPQFRGMVEDSFPVRTEGCIEPLWDNVQYQLKWYYMTWQKETRRRAQNVQNTVVKQEDVPELNWQIDHVRFPISVNSDESLSYALSQLNNEDGTPTDADIDALAQSVYQCLWWHLAEG